MSKCSFGDGTHFDKWFKRSANVSFKKMTKTNKKYIGFTCQNRIFVFFFYSLFCFRLDWLTHTLSHTGSVQEPKIVFQSIISKLIITRSLQFLIALTKFYLLQPSTSTDCFGRGFKTVYIAQIKKIGFFSHKCLPKCKSTSHTSKIYEINLYVDRNWQFCLSIRKKTEWILVIETQRNW